LLHQSLFHIAMNSSACKYYLYSYEKMIRMREKLIKFEFQEIGNKKYQKLNIFHQIYLMLDVSYCEKSNSIEDI